MRQILLLFIFILFAFICGSLLSHPVYKLLQTVTDIPFNKVVSHITSICGLLFVLAFLKFNSLLDRTTIGYQHHPRKGIGHDVLSGTGVGILIILVLEIVLFAFGVHQIEPDLNLPIQLAGYIILKALLTGIAVGVIEETLYRGALLGGLNKLIGSLPAILISSFIYSAVHFIKYPEITTDTLITWSTGLMLLPRAFFRFSDPVIIDSFLALFAFGVLLGLVRLNKGNIYQCIGIHAGVVVAIKLINKLTDYVPGNEFAFLVNTYDHMLGYLAFIWLLLISIFYYRKYLVTRTTQ